MTHVHDGRLPLFFQSNFVGKAATPSRGLCHQSRVAWQQNGPKLDKTCVCACVAKAIWVPNSVSVGKPHPWAFFLTGWAAGEVVLWEGRQDSWHSKWKPGILFSINTMCQETYEAPECNLPPSVARRWIWREGALLQTGNRPLPQEQCSAESSKRQRGIKGWQPLRQRQNLCAAKSTVEKKNIFSKTP